MAEGFASPLAIPGICLANCSAAAWAMWFSGNCRLFTHLSGTISHVVKGWLMIWSEPWLCFHPRLLPVPFKRKTPCCHALLWCMSTAKHTARCVHQAFYSFGQAWIWLYSDFASGQLSWLRDAPSAPQNQELPGKMPPTLKAQGGYHPVYKRLQKVFPGEDAKGARDVSWVSDPNLGPVTLVISQAPETRWNKQK